jgi:hypothetical protein
MSINQATSVTPPNNGKKKKQELQHSQLSFKQYLTELGALNNS